MSHLTYGPRDFPEDAIQDEDNGAYMNMCLLCREMFIGHKRRKGCKVCLAGATSKMPNAGPTYKRTNRHERHRHH